MPKPEIVAKLVHHRRDLNEAGALEAIPPTTKGHQHIAATDVTEARPLIWHQMGVVHRARPIWVGARGRDRTYGRRVSLAQVVGEQDVMEDVFAAVIESQPVGQARAPGWARASEPELMAVVRHLRVPIGLEAPLPDN